MKAPEHRIKIVEVSPRDGLQNDSTIFSVEERGALIRQLVESGVQFVEAGSFVSAKAIPAMKDSEKVWEHCRSLSADLSFLVPNEKGLERAMAIDVKSIAVFTATSDTFNQKNIGRSVDQSLEEYTPLIAKALQNKMRVRGYVSTAFGCPYEGPQELSRIVEVTGRLFEMGCDEVSVGDTIGVAHPKQVDEVFRKLSGQFPLSRLAGHFHDTRGMAIVNIKAALDLGIRIFDSSAGGLGGCPYAPGSSGNVATEEVIWFLEGLGFETGISLEKFLQTVQWLEEKAKRPLRSKLYASHPKQMYYFKP